MPPRPVEDLDALMPSALPDGEAAPADGRLPDAAIREVGSAPFSAYVHVPFCSTRCGYCDFNTYTASELGGVSQKQYVGAILTEIKLAREVVPHAPPLASIFFGGGTPTLLPAADQALIVQALVESFGIDDNCEVTTEANPESVSQEQLEVLRAAGINRISFGMQSSVEHVLHTLDRTHSPDSVVRAVTAARAAGFDNISLDLIYGTPGESVADWRTSLASVLELDPDHVSAYALIVEPGTALARRVARGELRSVDDDDQAEKYEITEDVLSSAGYEWYEVSNWARGASARSKHNLAYWHSEHWWGWGPGAHSHIGGVRWWNVKHPRAYAERMAAGRSPAHARELLDDDDRWLERVLLEVRLREGVDVGLIGETGRAVASELLTEGLIDGQLLDGGRLVLTLKGRLLADHVIRRLTEHRG
jgi:putative oxygen-independent coproporphyrinogen III oxidase